LAFGRGTACSEAEEVEDEEEKEEEEEEEEDEKEEESSLSSRPQAIARAGGVPRARCTFTSAWIAE